MRELGTQLVIWTGGESFSRTDFPKMLKHTNDLGIKNHIIINGTHIRDEVFETLHQVEPQRIDISLLSPVEAQHDRLAVRNGAFKKLLQFIEKCQKQKLTICLTMTLTKENSDTYHRFRSFCGKLGVQGRTSILVHPEYLPEDVSNTKYHRFRITDERCAELTSDAIVKTPGLNWSSPCYGGGTRISTGFRRQLDCLCTKS